MSFGLRTRRRAPRCASASTAPRTTTGHASRPKHARASSSLRATARTGVPPSGTRRHGAVESRAARSTPPWTSSTTGTRSCAPTATPDPRRGVVGVADRGMGLPIRAEEVHSWSMSGSSRITAVWEALKRFESDLEHHAITQDAVRSPSRTCATQDASPSPGERYGLGKPKQTRKIDAAVTSVLAHEAACDARAAGWGRKRKAYLLTGSTTRGF